MRALVVVTLLLGCTSAMGCGGSDSKMTLNVYAQLEPLE